MNIYLIGPGGVGKSTTGKILAELLNYDFLDLDEEFCQKIAIIGDFIQQNGYIKYCQENSKLFFQLNKHRENSVIALSSGFLAHEEIPTLAQQHQEFIKNNFSILLLPARSLKICEKIIIPRQLQRGFGLKAEREKEKLQNRFPIYQEFGNLKIYSHTTPEKIAKTIHKHLKFQGAKLLP